MFHAAQAALIVAGVKAARTHKGLRSQFGEYLVVPGLIEREHGKALTAAQEIRQESTYEAYALEDAEEVRNLIASAKRFLSRIEKFVAERRP
jgi:uncharacterized protein (UPF0332 family)